MGVKLSNSFFISLLCLASSPAVRGIFCFLCTSCSAAYNINVLQIVYSSSFTLYNIFCRLYFMYAIVTTKAVASPMVSRRRRFMEFMRSWFIIIACSTAAWISVLGGWCSWLSGPRGVCFAKEPASSFALV
jgi:hypothetical protein